MKSVSFQTDQRKFKATCQKVLNNVEIARLNMKDGVSQGFGFVTVRLYEDDDLDTCVKKLSQVFVDGYKWIAEAAKEKQSKEDFEELDTNKLIIKNVAF